MTLKERERKLKIINIYSPVEQLSLILKIETNAKIVIAKD